LHQQLAHGFVTTLRCVQKRSFANLRIATGSHAERDTERERE
jgi:hypothetical protein